MRHRVDEEEDDEDDEDYEDEEEIVSSSDDGGVEEVDEMQGDDVEEEEEETPGDSVEPLESRVYQLVHDVVMNEDINDVELTTQLNLIAEILEEVETTFRKESVAPYRRDGHLIGSLLQILDQQDEFYPMMESKLSELTDNRVKAAVCRVLLATVPVNSRFIVRLLYEEQVLDQICIYASNTEPPLRCYATGLLAVGLRDRSITDVVVNKEIPIVFLKRIRLYASKLEAESVLATKYIQDKLRHVRNGRKHPIVGKTAGTRKRKITRSGSEGNEDATENMDFIEDGENCESHGQGSLDHVSVATSPDLLGFEPDAERHEEDLTKLVVLELLYTLDCVGLMGEYLELFAPALKEDIITSIVTFLHSKHPTVVSHTLKLTSHFLAHKKFAFALIDAGGIDLIFTTVEQQSGTQFGVLDRSISMCLHGLASSNAVVEKLLSINSEGILSVAFNLLSSPNDRARQNAVVFFGLTLPFRLVLDFFEKRNGLYTLLNIVRAGNTPKSAIQRQLSHDACLCLRQYLRMHLALITHRLRRKLAHVHHPSSTPYPARVPKLSWMKPIDIDDKSHEQNLVFYETYRFSTIWSVAGSMTWSPAAKLSHLRGINVILEVTAMMATLAQAKDADEVYSVTVRGWIVERSLFCLGCLRILTVVVPSFVNEVCTTEITVDTSVLTGIESSPMNMTTQRPTTGLSILLEIVTSPNPRDSTIIREALYVLSNCVSPPHSEDCWQHPHKDIRQYTLTARTMRKPLQDAISYQGQEALHCCSRVNDDKGFRGVRKLAREKNAIKVCVQLLRYRRSVQDADAIRYLATRVLLGLARDRQIAQILEKMQIGQLLSDLIRSDPVLEENADLHVRFRESALDLMSQVTQRAPSAVINEATDPTVRKIEKASIVAQTKITYDANELLRLIYDHLIQKGLMDSAAALAREIGINTQSDRGNLRHLSGSKTPDRRDLKTKYRWTLTNPPTTDVHTIQRPVKIPRLSLHSDVTHKSTQEVDTLCPTLTRTYSDPTANCILNDVYPSYRHRTSENRLPITRSQRRKRIRNLIGTPHLFTNQSSRICSTHETQAVPPGRITGNQKCLGPSQLDGIITHYLREQHRQCANPVTTVPPFKLVGPDSFHHCPGPHTSSRISGNVCTRLMARSRAGFCHGRHALASPYDDIGINRYLFSRYRPFRSVGAHESGRWGTRVARFYGDDEQDMLLGNHDGQVRRVHIATDQIVAEWTCHPTSSAIVDIETNESTRLARSGLNRLLLTGCSALTEFGNSEIAVWDVNTMDTSARWRVENVLSPRFNHYGDRIVGLDLRKEEDEQVYGAVVIDIATGNIVCDLKDSVQSNEYKYETNCSFSACDGTILTDGMLWDTRIPTRALYKFDKLSNFGYGCFHPNGNEVIVNSAIWDVRTYRLLRIVPSLDKCMIQFNVTGTAMFAYTPHSTINELDRRRHKPKTWFRVLDARDYKDIATTELQRPIYDLSIDTNCLYLSIVEGRYLDAESSTEDDPSCRLYEIGRKRPSEDDSDVENELDEDSDTIDDDEFDDESESERDEENISEVDGDSDVDDDELEDYFDDGQEMSENELSEDASGREEDDTDNEEENQSRRRRRRRDSIADLTARGIQLFLLPNEEYYDDEYGSDDEVEQD